MRPRPGAARLHRRDRRAEHAVERAAPAGMRGTDDPGLGIGEQHRRAIRGQDAERHPGGGGDQRIARPTLGAGRIEHDRLGAVRLAGGIERPGRQPERRHRAGAVFRHGLGGVG